MANNLKENTMKNASHAKRLASELAQGSAQLNQDIALMSKHYGDLSPEALAKYQASMQETLGGLANTLSDIGFFLSQTEELAHDKFPPLTMPNITGKTQSEAESMLSGLGYTDILVIEKPGSVLGDVIRQFPNAGTVGARSDQVQVFVSNGIE
jgi:hypothetical protein